MRRRRFAGRKGRGKRIAAEESGATANDDAGRRAQPEVHAAHDHALDRRIEVDVGGGQPQPLEIALLASHLVQRARVEQLPAGEHFAMRAGA